MANKFLEDQGEKYAGAVSCPPVLYETGGKEEDQILVDSPFSSCFPLFPPIPPGGLEILIKIYK